MRIYVAGSSSEIPRVKKWLGEIQKFNAAETAVGGEAEGIVVTHDWVSEIEKYGANPKTNVLQRASWASDDLAGVREADLLWILMPAGMSDGVMWEGGYADALGMDILVSGPGHERTIFTARGTCFDTDESAYDYLIDTYYNDLRGEER